MARPEYHDPRDDHEEWVDPAPARPRHNLAGYRTVPYRGAEWLPDSEAQRFIGRARNTLWAWRRRGTVRAERVRYRGQLIWVYEPGSLKLGARAAKASKRNQRIVPGPGRGYRGARDSEVLEPLRELAAERQRARRARRGLSVLE